MRMRGAERTAVQTTMAETGRTVERQRDTIYSVLEGYPPYLPLRTARLALLIVTTVILEGDPEKGSTYITTARLLY